MSSYRVTPTSSNSSPTTSVRTLHLPRETGSKLMRCTEGDEVVAAASMQNDPIVAHVSELFALGKMISGRDIRGGQVRTPSIRASRSMY